MEISKKMNISFKNNTNEEIKVCLQTQALNKTEKKEQKNLFEYNLNNPIVEDRSIDTENILDIKIKEIDLPSSEGYKFKYDELTKKGGLFEKKTDGHRRRKLLVSIKNDRGLVSQSEYLLIGTAHENNLRLFPIANDTYGSTIGHSYLNDAEAQETIIESGKISEITFKNNDIRGNWMERLAIEYPVFKDMRLSEMIIPGSHDASTNNIGDIYNQKNNIAYCNEELSQYAGDLIQKAKIMDKNMIKKVARAQKLSIKEQLKCGSRYFDFRVTYSEGKQNLESPLEKKWFTIHTFLSNDAIEDLREIKEFANLNKNEIIIINLNRLIIDISEAHSNNINKQKEFLLFLENEFNERAFGLADLNEGNSEGIHNRKTIHDITYNDIIKKGKNVIFISSFDSANKKDKKLIAHELKKEFENLIFDIKVEHSKKKSWANTNSIGKLIKHEEDFIKNENNITRKLYKISLHATVIPKDYINFFKVFQDKHHANGALSLESYAIVSNSIMFNFIKKQIKKGNRINIITADYVGTSFNPAQWAMELNILKLQQTDYCDPNKLFEALGKINKSNIDFTNLKTDAIESNIKEFLMENKFVNEIEKALITGYGILKITNDFSPEEIFSKYKLIFKLNKEDKEIYNLCAHYIYSIYNKSVGIDILNKLELRLNKLDTNLNSLSNRLLKFDPENKNIYYIFQRWQNTFNIADKLKNTIDNNVNNSKFTLISDEIALILNDLNKNRQIINDQNERGFLKLSLVGSAIIYCFNQKHKKYPSVEEFKYNFNKLADKFKMINLSKLEEGVKLFFEVFTLNIITKNNYRFPEINDKQILEPSYHQNTIIQRKIFINMLMKFELINLWCDDL